MRSLCYRRGGRSAGFTLIELLAIMGIMIVLSAITVASYFGMTRGAGMRSAMTHLRSTLLDARQTAIISGRASCVVFSEDGYVLCRHEGRVSALGAGYIIDRYSDLSTFSEGNEIYNLDSPDGEKSVISSINHDLRKLYISTPIFTGVGERYGRALASPHQLPRGYQIGPGEVPIVPSPILFAADGTTASRAREIAIFEKIHRLPNDPHGKIIVKALTGFVSTEFGP